MLKVTTVLGVNPAEHVAPQSIPAGELLTVPEPVPPGVTVNVRCTSNVAVTFLSPLMLTWHVSSTVTVSQPLQVGGPLPGSGVPVSVTVAPSSSNSEHAAPPLLVQPLIVLESESTLPEPEPLTVALT